MTINPALALGQEFTGGRPGWSRKDVLLYHLSLGAGDPPTDPGELAYLDVTPLKILPTFAVIPTSGITQHLHTLPGMGYDPDRRVHGDHEVEILRPIPPEGRVTNRVRVAEIYDKGSGALIVTETETRSESGELLFINRRGTFVRGAGGFGGDRGPKASAAPPERKPDVVVEVPTLPQQALLYSLASGDESPLHTDPDFARRAGFEKPILHGLCTFGVVCKAAIDHALDGDPARVKRFRARFSGPVFPGETLRIAMWREDDRLRLEALVKGREGAALSGGVLELNG